MFQLNCKLTCFFLLKKKKKKSSLILYFSICLPPYLTESESYVGKFLLEGFVHVLFEVKGFDVFDDRSLKGKPEAVSK